MPFLSRTNCFSAVAVFANCSTNKTNSNSTIVAQYRSIASIWSCSQSRARISHGCHWLLCRVIATADRRQAILHRTWRLHQAWNLGCCQNIIDSRCKTVIRFCFSTWQIGHWQYHSSSSLQKGKDWQVTSQCVMSDIKKFCFLLYPTKLCKNGVTRNTKALQIIFNIVFSVSMYLYPFCDLSQAFQKFLPMPKISSSITYLSQALQKFYLSQKY